MIGVVYIGSVEPCPVCIGAGPIPIGAVITGPPDIVAELLKRSDFKEINVPDESIDQLVESED